MPPAWTAANRPGDEEDHRKVLPTDPAAPPSLLLAGEFETARHDDPMTAFKDLSLGDRLVRWRRMAAGFEGTDPRAPMARPVSAPRRPESISVDHHDPYLVNYRGEPLPLRLGSDSSNSPDCVLKDPSHWVAGLQSGVTERCEVSTVRSGKLGDPANVFISVESADGSKLVHGDPAVKPLVVYQNDPVLIRLIQGAQEVQHSFTIEGYTWPRNIDQSFPAELPRMDNGTPRATLVLSCQDNPSVSGGLAVARAGRPEEYKTWMKEGIGAFADPDALEFWTKYEVMLASCFNTEGRVAAQEIGISEHFEFSAAYLHDSNLESAAGLTVNRNRMSRLRGSVGQTREELSRTLKDLNDALLAVVPSDTLVHFGSTDALWNGAWTLLRVHPTAARRLTPAYADSLRRSIDEIDRALRLPDFSAPSGLPDRTPPLNGDRLLSPGDRSQSFDALRRGQQLLLSPEFLDVVPVPDGGIADGLRDPQGGFDLSAPVPLQRQEQVLRSPFRNERLKSVRPTTTTVPAVELRAKCDPAAPRVYSAIVAIEARSVFRGQTIYSSDNTSGTRAPAQRLHDPDGLFFAIVDPRRLLAPTAPDGVTAAQLDNPDSWVDVRFDAIVKEIRRVYDRPEPMVLNVKAGDCVHTVWLNALRGDAKTGRLSDLLGDAAMSGITSINVDADWPKAGAKNEPVDLTGTPRADVAPSSRLAISFPLPIMQRQRSYARPYGGNPVWSLAGTDTGADAVLSTLEWTDRTYKERTAQIMLTQFYAGRAVAPEEPTTPWMLLSSLTGPTLAPELAFLRQALEPLPINPASIDQAALDDLGIDPELARGQIAAILRTPTVGGLLKALDALGTERQRALQSAQTRLREAVGSDGRFGSGALTLGEAAPLVEMTRAPEAGSQARAGRAALVPGMGRVLVGKDVLGVRVTLDAETARALGLAQGAGPVDLDLADLAERLTDILPPERMGAVTAALADLDRALVDFDQRLDTLIAGLPVTQELLDIIAALDVHYVPYAFGALPVKSTGDVIGHGAHGLFGAITVAPSDASLTDVRVARSPLTTPGRSLCLSPRALALNDLARTSPYLARPGLIGDLPLRVPAAQFCRDFVMEPNPATKQDLPLWSSRLDTVAPDGSRHTIRQFTLFWQDGLNLRDTGTLNTHRLEPTPGGALGPDQKLVTDCIICDDSYDLGEKGVSYRSEPFHVRLRGPGQHPESHYNLNEVRFPSPFFRLAPSETGAMFNAPIPVLRVEEGEEITIHVVHPGGRARQRAFVSIAQDYDDLFHGFGFPRGALLAPGKAITAQMLRRASVGCYLWFDGPTQTRAGGTWGLIDVVAKGKIGDLGATSCERPAGLDPR